MKLEEHKKSTFECYIVNEKKGKWREEDYQRKNSRKFSKVNGHEFPHQKSPVNTKEIKPHNKYHHCDIQSTVAKKQTIQQGPEKREKGISH